MDFLNVLAPQWLRRWCQGRADRDWTREESSAQVGQLNALGNTGLSIFVLHFLLYVQSGT